MVISSGGFCQRFMSIIAQKDKMCTFWVFFLITVCVDDAFIFSKASES